MILSSERAAIISIVKRAMIEVAVPAGSPIVGVIHSIVLPEEKTSEVSPFFIKKTGI